MTGQAGRSRKQSHAQLLGFPQARGGAAQGHDMNRHRHAAVQVRALALEKEVLLDGEKNVKISGRSAAHARFALAGQADARAVLDARGNSDLQ